ncbi:hypothetical protein H5410_031239 [Solanum commersonii]|uniref:Uncharacterized protein n=1 Tax=Solanum commersonii TaxID=4109 RepID=A0A9J5YIK1_SOLCO|nr:hypothetical protein H5410_031239 [Solanum commersonii]
MSQGVAYKLWRMFDHFAGLRLEGQNLNQVLITWWTTHAGHKLATNYDDYACNYTLENMKKKKYHQKWGKMTYI